MIVREVARENSSQVGFVEHDQMIKAFATDRSDDSLDVRALPRRAEGNDDFLDAHVLDSILELVAVDAIAITNHVSWGCVMRERLDDLLRRPLGRWIRCDVEVDYHAAMMAEYDEAKQDAKRRCWHREEVNSDDVGQMIVQECPPGLRRRLAMADPVLVHSSLGRLVAKELEFRADSWSSPERVLFRHSADQLANFDVDLWPSRSASRLPSPVELEALLVPPDDRFWLHDYEDGAPIRPEAGDPGPEDPVPVPQPGSLRALLQYGELLPEDEVFGGQIGLVAKKRSKKNADHL